MLNGKNQDILDRTLNWYKPHCHTCPYLIQDAALDMDSKSRVAVRCVRPIGEGCIVLESVLIPNIIMKESYERAIKKLESVPERLAVPHKKINRRR